MTSLWLPPVAVVANGTARRLIGRGRHGGGRLADADHEFYFPALPVAELGDGEQPSDTGGLAGAGLAVAGRGPVLQPGQQVCSGGLCEAARARQPVAADGHPAAE